MSSRRLQDVFKTNKCLLGFYRGSNCKFWEKTPQVQRSNLNVYYYIQAIHFKKQDCVVIALSLVVPMQVFYLNVIIYYYLAII